MQEKVNPILSLPFPSSPELGAAIQVAEGVFWCRLPIPFELDHINVWLLDDGDGFTLVDTGINAGKTRGAWKALFSDIVKDLGINRVIVTHFHPDHFGLTKWLCDRTGASYHASVETQERTSFLLDSGHTDNIDIRMRFYQDHGVEDVEFFENFLKGTLYSEIVSGNHKVDGLLAESDTIEIGANTWRVIMCYGHAPGHINLYCERLGLLISGDQILPTITSNVSVLPDQPEANPLQEYLQSFAKFAQLPDETMVLPSHGQVFCGIHLRIDEVLKHHDEMLERVTSHCEQAHSAKDLVPKLFRRKLEGINSILAFGETMANLNYLCEEGKLQRRLQSGHYTYQQ